MTDTQLLFLIAVSLGSAAIGASLAWKSSSSCVRILLALMFGGFLVVSPAATPLGMLGLIAVFSGIAGSLIGERIELSVRAGGWNGAIGTWAIGTVLAIAAFPLLNWGLGLTHTALAGTDWSMMPSAATALGLTTLATALVTTVVTSAAVTRLRLAK